MLKQLQLNQCNLCLEKLYNGRQEDLTFQVILHFHLPTHQISVKSLPQPLVLYHSCCGSKHSVIIFPLLAFPFVLSLSGIMVASSKRKICYKQHTLNSVPLSEFTGNKTSTAFTQAEKCTPTRHSITLLFPQQLPSLSLFLPLEHTPTPLYAKTQEITNPS